MGMGEPFHNYDEVLGFCRLANDPDGFGLGARSIAISTAGWVPGIERLAGEPLQVKLAISLHGPNDDVRGEPDAGQPAVSGGGRDGRLSRATARPPTGACSSSTCCCRASTTSRGTPSELADLLHATAPGGFHVNLIVYNPTAADYAASEPDRVAAFRSTLVRRKIDHSLRRSRGRDIDAACGQLAVQGVRELRAARRGATRRPAAPRG